MKTILISLLDKEWPPDHSFISGMLAGEVAKTKGVSVRLCVSRHEFSGKKIARYNHAVCLKVLRLRRGLGRFLNFFIVLSMLIYSVKRESGRGNKIVIFVRNDPILLFAAALFHKRVWKGRFFNQAFSHEEVGKVSVKGIVAKILYLMSGFGVDAGRRG